MKRVLFDRHNSGTGPALRDVTPEATEAVCQKMMPGFGELMRQVSLKYVSTAILWRQQCTFRQKPHHQPSWKTKVHSRVFACRIPCRADCIHLLEVKLFLTCNQEVLKPFRPKS